MTYQEKLKAFYEGFDKTMILTEGKQNEKKDLTFSYSGEIPLLGTSRLLTAIISPIT